MPAIFSTEISSLESQVAALQARIVTLSECELEADNMFQSVQKTLGKISALSPDAVTTIKTALRGLLDADNNDGSDGSGGLPIPSAPQPQPDLGDSGLDGSSSLWASHLCSLLEDAPVTSLLGQSFEIACLIGHHDLLCEGQLLDPPGACYCT